MTFIKKEYVKKCGACLFFDDIGEVQYSVSQK